MSEYIHIVCLDAPSPPDYGGAIDMYYKITSLAALGKKIILHYFDYNQKRSADLLKEYCVEIHSYHRKSFVGSFSFSSPYIVNSRVNQPLIERSECRQLSYSFRRSSLFWYFALYPKPGKSDITNAQ